MSFCHLHVHDEYSLLDGLGTAAQYCERAKELGQEYIAITNHGNIDGAIKFQEEAKKAGIKPIFGAELYIVQDINVKEKEKRKHITVLVKNQIGWENLNKMLTEANLDGFYYKPRIDPSILMKYAEGLIFMSACTSSFISEDWGQKLLLWLKDNYPDSVYLEIMPHDMEQQIQINELAFLASDSYGIPLVATNDCHYVYPGDEEAHEVLLAIQSHKKWKDADRWKFEVKGLYLRSRSEMRAAFMQQGCSASRYADALDNTSLVAEMCCGFEIQPLDVDLPRVDTGYEYDVSDEDALRDLCAKAMVEKVKLDRKKRAKLAEYQQRLDEELEVIIRQKFTTYFLIVWELIHWCRTHDIMTGPGRGSSGGSLVCWLLGITSIDPIFHNLLFARFISPARIDLPDIDMDFEDIKRKRIWEHLQQTYGEDNVAGVSTFSTMKGRGALRDVSRVYDIPLVDVNAASSCIVVRSGGDFRSDFTITDAFDTFEDGRRFKAKYPKVAEIAIRLESQARSKGQHAAAMCVSKENLKLGKRGNLLLGNKGEALINWDKHDIEHVGLMKLDVLGISALTVLNETRKLIKERHSVDIDYEELPIDDEKVYEEFTEGNTVGVFQFGSLGLRKVCKEIGIDDFKILTHVNALFRPGTLRSGMVPEFQGRKNGTISWEHKHPFLAEITGDTYGIILYQEQVMRFMYDLGGLGWKTADTVRKVISKSQGVEQFMRFKDQFIQGCKERNTLDEVTAASLWDELSSFGSYGFNKSHAVAYSLIAYWEMYVKVYYPAEFICASLTYGSDLKKEEIIEEAIRVGLEIRPPKVGISNATDWTIKGNIIYCPFMEIKGIGEKTAAVLEEEARKKKEGFFDPNKKGKKLSAKFEAILQDIRAYDDEPLSEDDAERILPYFDFNLCRDRFRKYRKMMDRLSQTVAFRELKTLDFSLVDKTSYLYFGQMTQIKFGYKGKIDTLEKKLGISASSYSLGGVYGNFKDSTDFVMLIFGSELYLRKKDAIEHSSGEYLIAKANQPNKTTSIHCNNAWFISDIISGEIDGLGAKLITRKRFNIKDYPERLCACESCELRAECKRPVCPSSGFYNVMIVGEAPGPDEDEEGIGFIGRSGNMIWNFLRNEYGYEREDFHITNVAKCYPKTSRTPNKKQIAKCSKWLDEEISIIRPALILAFGNTSMEYFKGEGKGIMDMSGVTEWNDKAGAWVCYCIHPASVMYHSENKELFEKGMRNFAEKIKIFGGIITE